MPNVLFSTIRRPPPKSDDMSGSKPSSAVSAPVPIYLVAHRYMLYDIDTVLALRRDHHIIGTLIGTLPQSPQQNVFCGLPLELMPEEARLLVEEGVAYVVDDVQAHKQGFLDRGLSGEERKMYVNALQRQGADAGRVTRIRAAERKERGLAQQRQKQARKDLNKSTIEGADTQTEDGDEIPSNTLADPTCTTETGSVSTETDKTVNEEDDAQGHDSLFTSREDSISAREGSRSATPVSVRSLRHKLTVPDDEIQPITPTTSYPPLPQHPNKDAPPLPTLPLPTVPTSYPLFKFLHSRGYFLAPGLRFGCQYMAYPGDPLRYHSHFLCNGLDWDQDFDLMELVGGGRLGTGVKKGFLIGGEEQEGKPRAFCVEWSGM
ncbi:tRNA-splicing endonuclease subunit [Elasticomyces elasticus]|nr:tRNA-splicing endonuclease subunit [Elasticomyces elasticus]KAK5007533.1 hypothetical protein LTR28_005168 [Elasticomyces elasticus]